MVDSKNVSKQKQFEKYVLICKTCLIQNCSMNMFWCKACFIQDMPDVYYIVIFIYFRSCSSSAVVPSVIAKTAAGFLRILFWTFMDVIAVIAFITIATKTKCNVIQHQHYRLCLTTSKAYILMERCSWKTIPKHINKIKRHNPNMLYNYGNFMIERNAMCFVNLTKTQWICRIHC